MILCYSMERISHILAKRKWYCRKPLYQWSVFQYINKKNFLFLWMCVSHFLWVCSARQIGSIIVVKMSSPSTLLVPLVHTDHAHSHDTSSFQGHLQWSREDFIHHSRPLDFLSTLCKTFSCANFAMKSSLTCVCHLMTSSKNSLMKRVGALPRGSSK